MVMELLLSDQPPREDLPDGVSPFWHGAEIQDASTARASRPTVSSSRISPIPPWPSISMPASIAASASAPAARCRSMT